jgi:hypothetical protein
VKLPGWIKSVAELVKMPSAARQVEPPPNVPHETDSRTPLQNPSLDDSAVRPGGAVDVAPEIQVGVEYPIDVEPEVQVGVERPIDVEAESPVSVETQDRVNTEPETSPGPQEIDRRRGVVRAFFNDYWSTVDDKPASFAERLDLAEGYINERVAAGGEAWRLGPATRKQLGLPASKKA